MCDCMCTLESKIFARRDDQPTEKDFSKYAVLLDVVESRGWVFFPTGSTLSNQTRCDSSAVKFCPLMSHCSAITGKRMGQGLLKNSWFVSSHSVMLDWKCRYESVRIDCL